MRPPRIQIGLCSLLVLALALRFAGIGWMLPHLPEQDDFVATHLHLSRTGEQYKDGRLAFSQCPLLLAGSVHALPGPESDPERLARMDLAAHRANASWDWVLVRGAVGLWSILGVIACFAIARRFLAPGWALYAAAFVPASLLLVNFGQQGRPHGALAGLVPLAVAAAMRLRREPSARNHLLAAGAVALAAGCLHSGWLTGLSLAAVYVFSRGAGRPWLDRRALLSLAVLVASVPVFYHLILVSPLSPHEAASIAPGQHATDPQWLAREVSSHLDLVGARRMRLILLSWEPALVLGSVLAAVMAVWKRVVEGNLPRGVDRRADLLVVLAFVAPYVGLFSIFAKTNERYMIPLLPFMAVATAWGMSELAARAGRGRALVHAGALLLLCFSSAAGLKLVWLRTRPDTLSEAARFLSERAEPEGADSIYITPPIDLPLARTRRTLLVDGARQPSLHGPWARYQAGLPDKAMPAPRFDVEWLDYRPGIGDLGRDEDLSDFLDFYGPGWFVVEPERARKHAWFARVRGGLAERGTLVARISPDGYPAAHESGWIGQDRAYAYGGDWPNNTLRVLRLRAIGPLLEIYRIEPRAGHPR